MDWEKAETHLRNKKTQYEQIQSMQGASASFALTIVIYPLLERFKGGERTEELYNEIMEIE